MRKEDYEESIKEEGKFVILTDTSEIYKVFDTPEMAHEYASARVKHTKFNKIDIYVTTGKPITFIDGMRYMDDIKPYQQHHIGLCW